MKHLFLGFCSAIKVQSDGTDSLKLLGLSQGTLN